MLIVFLKCLIIIIIISSSSSSGDRGGTGEDTNCLVKKWHFFLFFDHVKFLKNKRFFYFSLEVFII